MLWLPFSIIGAFIGGCVGLTICGDCAHSAGDAIGAVLGIFYMAIGALAGLIVGCIGGLIFSARAKKAHLSSVESQSAIDSADKWFDGGSPCPYSGLWVARVDDSHALADAFNIWNRTARVLKGDRFPHPSTMLAGVVVADIRWKCLDGASDRPRM
ncbi:hypothetical protein [Variovorax boronicumulans]|jgi:hypothetical protein|uniref:hypothetical protein n=1 Tax=Variovorax boronicumulans TaxID=436515 RepID=UPI00117E0047|nr:hypothetical protein [Variovorax boronicumulans]